MSVTFGSTSSAHVSAGTVTLPHTVAAGDNRLLIVALSMYVDAPATVTYGGVGLTQVGREVTGGNATELWALLDPPVGTADVSLTLSSNGAVVAAVCLYGVDTTDPYLASVSKISSFSPYSEAWINIPSRPGGLAIAMIGYWGSDLNSAGDNHTVHAQYNLGDGDASGILSSCPGSVLAQLRWAYAGANPYEAATYWVIALPVNPAEGPVAPGTPSLIHVYNGPQYYRATRSSGTWSVPQRFASTSSGVGHCSTSEVLSVNDPKWAVISTGSDDVTQWHGKGVQYPFTVSGDGANPVFQGYWNCSWGPWWIGDAWYVLLGVRDYWWTKFRLNVYQSIAYDDGDTDRPTTWQALDYGHSPTLMGSTIRWGINARRDPDLNCIDIFGVPEPLGPGYVPALVKFDLETKTWGTPYASWPASIDSLMVVPQTSAVFNNGVYRFPNGDIGVVYFKSKWYSAEWDLYYRLWSPITGWSEIITLRTTPPNDSYLTLGTVLPDPSKEKLHVFSQGDAGYYDNCLQQIVTHEGVVTDGYDFPGHRSEDGFGNPTIYGDTILVPCDSITDATYEPPIPGENLVWSGPVSGGTFIAETVPRPYGETGTPSCASLFHIYDRGSVPTSSGHFAYFGNPVGFGASAGGWFL